MILIRIHKSINIWLVFSCWMPPISLWLCSIQNFFLLAPQAFHIIRAFVVVVVATTIEQKTHCVLPKEKHVVSVAKVWAFWSGLHEFYTCWRVSKSQSHSVTTGEYFWRQWCECKCCRQEHFCSSRNCLKQIEQRPLYSFWIRVPSCLHMKLFNHFRCLGNLIPWLLYQPFSVKHPHLLIPNLLWWMHPILAAFSERQLPLVSVYWKLDWTQLWCVVQLIPY